MVNVSQELVGRRVRITRAECSSGPECRYCNAALGKEGTITRISTSGAGAVVTKHDGTTESFIREVELLDTPATTETVPVFAPGSVVEVTGDTSDHGWSIGTQVTLTQAPGPGWVEGWLATTRPWFPGAPVPGHIAGSGSEVRYIRETDFRAVAAPTPETVSVYEMSDGSTWRSGERVRAEGRGDGLVLAETDADYRARWEPEGTVPVFRSGPNNLRDYMPIRFDNGNVEGHFARRVTRLSEPALTPETFELSGRTFTVGRQMNVTGGRANPVTVLAPTDDRYLREYGRFTAFVPTINSNGFVDGINPANLIEITTSEETTVPTSTPTSRVTFTAEQQQRLREVVGDFGRRHGACAVAADALRELGVEQPQLTQTVSVTITLTVPVANYTGQVQLPSGAPEGYLAKVIPARELNAIADRMIRDAGSAVRRQGDTTAEVTAISAS